MPGNVVTKIDETVEIRHILVSVYDKRGLASFIPELVRLRPGLVIYSTGGTYRAIEKILKSRAEGTLVPVSRYTGQPEMQGGLVKTLDFKIYLGLLSETYNSDHAGDLKRLKAVPIDMVVANLYPFRQTIQAADATPELARANIDIGGPCMIRAAAKNYLRVTAVTDPADYPRIVSELEQAAGRISLRTRYDLAAKSFAYTAEYDTCIARYLAGKSFAEVAGCYKSM
jgi:phosphoribosylaminoimidazolecarboxamide formyltransferase/IMP cyclohydrolase